jgi:hypothetical protein
MIGVFPQIIRSLLNRWAALRVIREYQTVVGCVEHFLRMPILESPSLRAPIIFNNSGGSVVGRTKNSMVSRNVVRNSTRSNFILIRPRALENADLTAKAIAICKGVRKVFVTSGAYGFIVSTDKEESSDEIRAVVGKTAGSQGAKVARGHYVYACRARG